MTKTSKATILICGGTSIAATIIFYLLAFDNIFTIPMRWLSLSFLLLTEVIGTVKAIGIKKTIFGVANIFTSVIHLGVVLVMSVIFVNFLPFHLITYILLNILALCALLVVDVIVAYFSGYIANKNQKLAESQAIVDSCYAKAKSIYTEYSGSEYKKELNDIVEMIQYSDNSSQTNDEMGILNKLDELQELLSEKGEGISDKITELNNLIKLRSIKKASQKRGGY